MKNVLYLVGLVWFLLIGCGKSSSYIVNGVVEGVKDGKVFILKQDLTKDKLDTLVSGVVKDGKFKIKGEVVEPTVGFVGANGKMGSIIFLENDAVYEVHLQTVEMPVITGGGVSQRLHQAFVDYDLRLSEEYQKMSSEMIEIMRVGDEARNRKFQDKIKKLRADTERAKDAYLREHANTFFGLYELSSRATGMDATSVQEWFDLCSDDLKEMEPGKYIRSLIPKLAKIAIGVVASDFTAQTPEGKDVSLYGIKGKLKLLDCWSSTCGICRAEIKRIIPIYDKYQSRGFEILGLSFDKSHEKWVEAIKKDGATWVQVSDLEGIRSPLAHKYGVWGLPSNLLLDEENRVIARNISSVQLNEILSKYFTDK